MTTKSTSTIIQNENHWRARPSAAVGAASYKSGDDIRRSNGNDDGGGGVVGVGKITSPYNPHLQSGQDKRGIGCLKKSRPNNPPPPTVQVTSPKYQATSTTSPKNPASNPLRRSASVGDWRRKYLFLEDPEARRGGERQEEEGARDSFVEQKPVTGRTFDPLSLREGGHLVSDRAVGVNLRFYRAFLSRKECPQSLGPCLRQLFVKFVVCNPQL